MACAWFYTDLFTEVVSSDIKMATIMQKVITNVQISIELVHITHNCILCVASRVLSLYITIRHRLMNWNLLLDLRVQSGLYPDVMMSSIY